MILATHGIVGSISGIDADWLAYYNRVIAAGGSLTTTEQNATKTLVADLKSYGIWSAMKAVYPMVGASAAACAQNLKSSSFTGTFTSGWTFASTGVTPNGTSAYMDTFVVPETHLNKNSTHLSIYSRTDLVANTFDIGSTTATGTEAGVHIATRYTNIFYPRVFDSNSGISNLSTLGFFMGNRQNNTTIKARRNTIENTITSNSVTSNINNFKLFIGCVNVGNTALLFSSRSYAFASIGDGLTDTEASNFYTAVQAFQTTLSRQV